MTILICILLTQSIILDAEFLCFVGKFVIMNMWSIDNAENVLTPDENIEQPQKPQSTYEKFYLHIQYISEEEVLVGVKNGIKIESNFFSTDAILQEVLSLLGLNKSGDNILHKECILNAPICETMQNIDAKSIEITAEYNFSYFSSEGEDVLGDLFYCIRDISNSLFETIDIENILRQMRQDLSDLRDCFTRRTKKGSLSYHFNCGYYSRYGKHMCSSHYISAKDLEEIVLWDIRTMAQRITLDEAASREEYLRHNAELADKAVKTAKRELQVKRKRIDELSRLMQVAYEDRVKGIMPEDICLGFIQKYSDEQKTLKAEIEELEKKIQEIETTQQSADNFIRDIKKYLNAPELTREMCYELIDRIIIDAPPKNAEEQRNIEIVYKVDIASVLRHKLPR